MFDRAAAIHQIQPGTVRHTAAREEAQPYRGQPMSPRCERTVSRRPEPERMLVVFENLDVAPVREPRWAGHRGVRGLRGLGSRLPPLSVQSSRNGQ